MAGTSHPRRVLAELNLSPRKRLGQNFLIGKSFLARIVRAADLSSRDTVVEVGPGLGVLTDELLKQAGRVIAIELDDALAEALKQRFSGAGNLTVINGDILKISPGEILSRAGIDTPYKLVANLPYYITSAVLRHFLESARRPELIVVMVQREVAESITAKPGDLSLLGLSVQLFGSPRVVARVPAGAFYPPPKVESSVVKITMYPAPVIPDNELPGFFTLARVAFCAARKQLPNALAQGMAITKEEILNRLAAAGIDPRRRAETLSIPEWVLLWKEFKALICP